MYIARVSISKIKHAIRKEDDENKINIITPILKF